MSRIDPVIVRNNSSREESYECDAERRHSATGNFVLRVDIGFSLDTCRVHGPVRSISAQAQRRVALRSSNPRAKGDPLQSTE